MRGIASIATLVKDTAQTVTVAIRIHSGAQSRLAL